MLDLNYVRGNLDKVQQALVNRGVPDEVFQALESFRMNDDQRRRAIAESDKLNAERNEMSEKIGALMKEGKAEEALSLRTRAAGLKRAIDKASEERERFEVKVRELLSTLPNIPH